MGILITVLIIAAVITLVLCLRISVRIRAGDETSLTAIVGFIKIKLYPRREKRLKLSDFGIKKFRKLNQKDKPKKPKKPKKSRKSGEREAPEAEEETDVLGTVGRFSRVASVFLKRLGHYLHIELGEVALTVSTGDAASTAILYGVAAGIMQNLYALLISCGNLHTHSGSCFTVDADFTSGKTTVRIDVTFSFRIWQLIDVGVRSFIEYLRGDGGKTETA